MAIFLMHDMSNPAPYTHPPKTQRNVQRLRGGLVLKAHRRLYYSTLGLRGIKKKRRFGVYRVDKGLGDGDLLDARHVEAVHVVPEMDLLVLL